MNAPTATNPFRDARDHLLAAVALRIQLSPTDYRKAVERYEAINAFLDRPDSPLHGLIEWFYPQGSMVIGSTIASRFRATGHDLDTIAQMRLAPDSDPQEVLDRLFKALNGTPGSLYHGKVTRNSRCVTVNYADGMSIDVTPMVRRPSTPERESVLFHHRRESPGTPGYRKVANPHGFAAWFNARTPAEKDFGDRYAQFAESYDIRADAEQEPVPDQEPLRRKSMALVALQLLKRFRNIRYEAREGRMPPSAVLTKWVGDGAGSGTTRLVDELLHHARRILAILESNLATGRLVHEANPVCAADVLTDRWPENRADQALFAKDLSHLVAQLVRLNGDCSLGDMREILVDLFGEGPSAGAVQDFGERFGRQVREGSTHTTERQAGAGLLTVTLPLAAASAAARATPKHTFFGDELGS